MRDSTFTRTMRLPIAVTLFAAVVISQREWNLPTLYLIYYNAEYYMFVLEFQYDVIYCYCILTQL